MNHTYLKKLGRLRRMAAIVLALALAGMTPLTALAEAMVVNTNSRVYQRATLSSRYAALKKGTEVNLLATWNGWARIERNGVIGYTNADHLSPAGETAIDFDELMANAQEAVITKNTRVYQSASTSARSMSVSKGMKVNLLAVSGQWALVENSGNFAYMNASHLTTQTAEEPDLSGLLANAKTVVINCNTRVYQSASTSARWLSVPKGMKVNLLAVNGQWAMVENSGNTAYMNVDHLSSAEPTPEPTAAPTPVPTATPEPEQPDYSGYLKDAQDAQINQDTRVYRFADLSSSSVEISKGTQVQLLKVNGSWALIERGGSYGFTNAAHVTVTPKVTPTPTPTPTSTPTPAASDDYLSSSKYTNEEKCYLFMVKEMGLNSAAACGILANIYKESSFRPTAGSSYYGLCQWGGGRLSNLKSYCEKNGYSYSSVEGQLRFMYHELKNSYPKILSALKSVENTADGAYEAGYTFCYQYERPANKASVSVVRGNYARDTYFPKYN